MLTERQKKLADSILEVGAVKFGEFKLKLHEKNPSAPPSPIYIDLRKLRSRPQSLRLVAEILSELAQPLKFDCLADVPTAATPFVAVLSTVISCPMISPRIDKKRHGSGTSIDGLYESGQTALVIDDLITKAESKLEIISVLEKGGLKVHDVLVLIDREQGGVQKLRDRGYSCYSALSITALLEYYRSTGKIDVPSYTKAINYFQNTRT